MWILIQEGDPGPGFRTKLLCGQEYSVGRRDCDFVIENDMSISRKHAVLLATHIDVRNPQKPPLLTIQDLSKLGTTVNDKRIVKDKAIVSNQTSIVFGNAGTSKYRVELEPYVMTTSCLDVADKKAVQQLSVTLGAHVVGEWRKDCLLLVMTNLSITIKAICALIAQRPIVTPDYLDKLVESIKKKTAAPEVDDYLPPLAESQLDPKLVSFQADPRRLKVFEQSLVIFLSAKQFKKLSIPVELGGGTPILLEEGTDDNEDDILVGPRSCVMVCDPADESQHLTQNAKEWIRHVQKILKKKKKRMIQECEVGYAVLYCSVDRYCNPNVDLAVTAQAVPGQSLSQADMSQLLKAANKQYRDESSLATEASPSIHRPSRAKTKPDLPKDEPRNIPKPEERSKQAQPSKKRALELDSEVNLEPVGKRRSIRHKIEHEESTSMTASVPVIPDSKQPFKNISPEPKYSESTRQAEQNSSGDDLFSKLTRNTKKKKVPTATLR